MPEHSLNEFGNQIFHLWEVPEFEKHAHSRRWYLVAAILTVAAVAYALLTNNPFFAIILVLIAIVFVVHEIREPGLVQFGITDKGVVWRGFLFPYAEIKNFWIVYDPPRLNHLYLIFHSTTRPRLSVDLAAEDPAAVRTTLKRFITEDVARTDEPLTDAVGRILKM